MTFVTKWTHEPKVEWFSKLERGEQITVEKKEKTRILTNALICYCLEAKRFHSCEVQKKLAGITACCKLWNKVIKK